LRVRLGGIAVRLSTGIVSSLTLQQTNTLAYFATTTNGQNMLECLSLTLPKNIKSKLKSLAGTNTSLLCYSVSDEAAK
jgi:hypothetical protein